MIPIIQTLGDRAVAEMLARAQEINVRARQADASRRIAILSENWADLVYAFIDSMIVTPSVRVALKRRVNRTYNVLSQICTRVCVAYKVPPIRYLEGVSDEVQSAFAKLMVESGIATKAKAWERHTFAGNVCIVVPRVRETAGLGPRLDYDVLLPDRTEVYTDERDPMGCPVLAVHSEKHGSDYTGDPIRQVVIDDEAWTYYDSRGRTTGTITHGAGVFPGTVWRLDLPVDDWWSSHRGAGIVDATITVAYLAARRDWVRGGQDRKKELMAAADLAQIPQQIAGAEGPVHIPLAPSLYSYQVLDAVTSIDEHEKHIKSYLRQAAEYLGVPSQLVDFDALDGNEGERAIAIYSALADLRASHIEYYRQAERELAWKTALVLRGMGHPAARLLPPDLVLESFRIQYPELTFAETPSLRLSAAEKRVALGLSSTFREYQREHPSKTIAEAREDVLTFAIEEGELNQFYIDHNISRDPATRLKTVAQLQGSQGGQAKAEQDDDDGPDRPDDSGSDGADDSDPDDRGDP